MEYFRINKFHLTSIFSPGNKNPKFRIDVTKLIDFLKMFKIQSNALVKASLNHAFLLFYYTRPNPTIRPLW